jgi:hypothetical protein
MKNRRNFLKSSALLATGMAVSAPLLAKTKSKKTPVFPGVELNLPIGRQL